MRFLLVLTFLLAACSSPAPPPPTSTTAPPPKPAAAPSPSLSPSPLASPSAVASGKIPTADPAVHVFLWGNAGTTQRDLALAKNGGFHWVKQRFEWRNIEGKSKGEFEWNEPDRIVDAILMSAEDGGAWTRV